MTQVHDIRKMYFEEGKSISEISRETGRDRKTVSMYLEKDDWNEENTRDPQESVFPKLAPFKNEIEK